MDASPVQPRVDWRSIARRLALLGLAVAVGLFLERRLEARLQELDALGHRSYADLLIARKELARLLQRLAVAVFGATAAVGVAAIAACLKSLRLGVFPAPGTWSWALRHKLTGRQAVLAARVGMGLGATLVLVSAAGGGLLWYMAAVVRACRAH